MNTRDLTRVTAAAQTYAAAGGMVRPHGRWILIVSLAALACTRALSAQSVALKGPTDIGQGFLRPRGINECYVVTPLHVLPTSGLVQTIWEGKQLGEAGRFRLEFKTHDLAVLEHEENPGLECPPWNVSGNVSAILSDGSVSAVLRMRTDDGNLTFLPVWVRNVQREYVTIALRDGQTLQGGWSGSQLLVGGMFVGILQSVTDEGREGRVLRSDVIDMLINSFFTAPRNRDPDLTAPPLGAAASEPNLWLRNKQSVVLGNRNTSFGVIYDNGGSLRILSNEVEHVMYPGTRLPFSDTRGSCYIIYMGMDDPDRQNSGDERYGFLVACTPT